MKYSLISLPVLLAASLTLAAEKSPIVGTKVPATTKSTPLASDQGLTIGVNGMTCGSCRAKVQSELEKLKAEPQYQGKIKNIAVDLKAKVATIQMIETIHMTEQEQEALRKDVAAAVTRAGYEPVLTATPQPKTKG